MATTESEQEHRVEVLGSDKSWRAVCTCLRMSKKLANAGLAGIWKARHLRRYGKS